MGYRLLQAAAPAARNVPRLAVSKLLYLERSCTPRGSVPGHTRTAGESSEKNRPRTALEHAENIAILVASKRGRRAESSRGPQMRGTTHLAQPLPRLRSHDRRQEQSSSMRIAVELASCIVLADECADTCAVLAASPPPISRAVHSKTDSSPFTLLGQPDDRSM